MKKTLLFALLLLVSSLAIAANLINENIQSWTNRASYGSYTQTITAGIVSMTRCMVANAAAATGTCSIGRVQMEASTGIIELPALATCGTAEFHMVAGGSSRSIKLQSFNGSTWTDLTTFTGIGTTGATFTYNVNSSSSTTLRLASPSAALYVHDIIITDYSSPTISVSPSTLTGFTYVQGSGPSTSQSYSLSGSNLTGYPGNITVTSPTNYEVSTDNSSFGTSKTVAYSSATLAATAIYVRLKQGLSIGSYNSETVSNAGGGATTQNVTCSGSVTSPPPPPAPTANEESNTTNSGFTATWGSASGATGYKLDAYTQAQTPATLTEGFDNGVTPPAGWTFTGITNTYTSSGNYGLSSPSLSFNDSNDRIVTTTFTNPSSLSFWIKGQTTDASSALLVEKFDGSSWSTIENIVPLPTTGTTKSYTLSSNIIQVRFTYTKSAGNLAFDDVSIPYTATSITYVSGYQDLDVGNVTSYQVTGLNPLTTYYYRVRAYNTYGTSGNSNEISVTTLSTPVLSVSTSALTDFSYIVGNGPSDEQTFTFSATDVYDNVFLSVGDWFEISKESGQNFDSSLSYGPPTKFNLTNVTVYVRMIASYPVGSYNDAISVYSDGAEDKTVTLSGHVDEPLPVVLSSFTASISVQNNVMLTWVTQTETGMLGYYIYRSGNGQLANAELVSPMIGATNTATQQIYSYTDSELYTNGDYYYWLESVDFDGNNGFHGPVSVLYDTSGEYYNPEVPLATELKAIYPNPFNPLAFIPFSLASTADVSIQIYNNRGQLLRDLDLGTKIPGEYRIEWNGTDNNGQPLSTGVYYIRMTAGKDSFQRKAVLLK